MLIGATSVRMPPRQIDLKFDRSFVLALQDIETGAVLFAGAVNKPNGDMKPAAPAPV
jgi:serine protease inhibitor